MDDSSRIDNHLSPANKINNDRRIIQHDIIDADLTLKDMRHAMHTNQPVDWPRYEQAAMTQRRALKHQPGEAGSSTIHKNSIVRRGPE